MTSPRMRELRRTGTIDARAARGEMVHKVGIVFGVACGVCIAAFVVIRQHSSRGATEGVPAPPSPAPSAPIADWCAPEYEPVADGCLAGGDASRADPRPVVVYLHGRYARTAAGEEISRQRRLAQRATKRGFAVLALRGRLGGCSDPALADWYCWPSNERNAASASEVVGSWTAVLAATSERARPAKRFLLGFSNGGYFAGLIASRGLLDVAAVAVAHGGPVEPVHAVKGTPPLLLLSADDDVAQDDMIRYGQELVREGWSHDSYARSGGHALSDEDIDAVLSFFARSGEPLPLVPPLPLHRPVFHIRDAGALLEASSDPAPPDEPEDPEEASAEIADE
jgi:dienelactone hydrolase